MDVTSDSLWPGHCKTSNVFCDALILMQMAPMAPVALSCAIFSPKLGDGGDHVFWKICERGGASEGWPGLDASRAYFSGCVACAGFHYWLHVGADNRQKTKRNIWQFRDRLVRLYAWQQECWLEDA